MSRTKLHITWVPDGFWMLSAEDSESGLRLLICDFQRIEHVIEDARELIADGTFPDAVILIDLAAANLEALENTATTATEPQPQPRKVEL